jgi:putative flippase GtrA
MMMGRIMPPRLVALLRQFTAFFGVGVVAAFAHYAVLIALVELLSWRAVPGTLMGYIAGGIVSYALNHRFTYQSTRSHGAALWRFTLVAAVGFFITWGLMHLLVERLGVFYILAQVITHAIVLFWSFFAHKYVSFRDGM